jgi:hypothetical protein
MLITVVTSDRVATLRAASSATMLTTNRAAPPSSPPNGPPFTAYAATIRPPVTR